LSLGTVELIINCQSLDIGTGWTKSRHCTLTALAADWAAIQSGELGRFNAWTGGKLEIDGDMTLML
jgi:putative sterol carrier protein